MLMEKERLASLGQLIYYLPFAVDALIKAGKATAKVLKTSARWYGVTYREDKPVITAAVSQMTADGEYPEDL